MVTGDPSGRFRAAIDTPALLVAVFLFPFILTRIRTISTTAIILILVPSMQGHSFI